MEAYRGFSQVYDFLMQDVDYDKWVEYIEMIFKKYNAKPEIILELACGTGNITNRLAKKGYKMYGIDISNEMLAIAKSKSHDLGVDVVYLNQDMKELEFVKKVDCVLCICDGFNYILDDKSLLLVFNNIYSILKDKGLFIFDISSYYKISKILGNNTYAESFEDVAYIWENHFNCKNNICEMDLTIFIRKNNFFERIIENHKQKAYKKEEVQEILSLAGFVNINCYEAFTFNKCKYLNERINFICQK